MNPAISFCASAIFWRTATSVSFPIDSYCAISASNRSSSPCFVAISASSSLCCFFAMDIVSSISETSASALAISAAWELCHSTDTAFSHNSLNSSWFFAISANTLTSISPTLINASARLTKSSTVCFAWSRVQFSFWTIASYKDSPQIFSRRSLQCFHSALVAPIHSLNKGHVVRSRMSVRITSSVFPIETYPEGSTSWSVFRNLRLRSSQL